MAQFRMLRWLSLSLLVVLSTISCRKPMPAEPDYSRPLPPGMSALRKITDPAQLPDLSQAFNRRDAGLEEAAQRSLKWFEIPSTRKFFPVDAITHQQAHASTYAFLTLLKNATTAQQFSKAILDEFDVYTSVGWDGSGTVLFTGYYSPIFPASKVRTAEFNYPLYRRPADLLSDPATGQVLGRQVGNQVQPYPTRGQIESSGMLSGTELVYLRSKLDAYIVHVQGSAKLAMTDGSTLLIGYAGNNGHDYTSVGRILVDEGKIPKDRLNLATLRLYFTQNPSQLDHYLNQNQRYVFFQPYSESNWPAGSLGFKVTPMRSLATDKSVFPRGSVTLVSTQAPDRLGQLGSFEQFMLDQDTGGAIHAAGRGDIYMGIGPEAERKAGYQYAEGRLYYFFLKIPRVSPWVQRMNGARSSSPN